MCNFLFETILIKGIVIFRPLLGFVDHLGIPLNEVLNLPKVP